MSDNRWKVKTIENYVLLNKDINEIEIDESDEWQFPDYISDYASIKIWVGDNLNNDLRKRLELDKDEQDFLDNEGWVDCYVNIDVKTDTIFNIYVSAYLGDHEKDLDIHFDLPDMGKRLYDYLLNSHGGYAEFISECKAIINKELTLKDTYSVCIYMTELIPEWDDENDFEFATMEVKGDVFFSWYLEENKDNKKMYTKDLMIERMNHWIEEEYTADEVMGLYDYARPRDGIISVSRG